MIDANDLPEVRCPRCGKIGRPFGETFIAGKRRYACGCGRVWLELIARPPRLPRKVDAL
jgi:hypothetical protein